MGKFQITIVSVLVLILGACTEAVTPIPYEYTKIFTGENSKTWQVIFLEQTLNGEVEVFNVSCALDDEYVFYANSERIFKAVTGSEKCSTDESDVITDSWGFNNATATLTMVLPCFTESSLPFIVRDARKSKLELEFFLDEENTTSYRIHLESTKEN